MKITVTMKDPDTLHDAIGDALEEALPRSGLDEDERDLVRDSRHEKIKRQCSKWFKYGECLSVEIDTDAGTCVVKETT